eukprot:11179146-Lingulodinium_polyedra.AAC.1
MLRTRAIVHAGNMDARHTAMDLAREQQMCTHAGKRGAWRAWNANAQTVRAHVRWQCHAPT